MLDNVKDIISSIVNPNFEDVLAEPLIFRFGDLQILGYTGNVNEKQLDEGMSSLKVIEVMTNNLLFDPDKVSLINFDFPASGIIGDLILDEKVILGDTLTIDELVTKFNELEFKDIKIQIVNDNVTIYKVHLLTSQEAFKELYVEGTGLTSIGVEEGYCEAMKASFWVNGYKYEIRDNTFKPCYMNQYLKFQLVRK